MTSRKFSHLGLSLLGLLLYSMSANAQAGESNSSLATLDYPAIKRDLAVFQGVVDTTVKQTVPGFLPVLGSTKGVYLPEYGAVFGLEVNLYRIRQLSPFDLRPLSQQELEEAYTLAMKRLDSVKGNLIKVMGEHGSALGPLKPPDYLTVVVYIFPVETGTAHSLPSQLVLRAKRSMINDYRENKLSFPDFAKKVEVALF
jgi:hypothetical protein